MSLNESRYIFPREPKAHQEAIVAGPRHTQSTYRFTVLTPGLIRYEYAADCKFEDRASTFAINRALSVPKFRVVDTGRDLEIITEKFHLRYDKESGFSPSGLTAQVLGGLTEWHSVWRYGDFNNGLGGTARTLDEADGRIELGPGVISRHGSVVFLIGPRALPCFHAFEMQPVKSSASNVPFNCCVFYNLLRSSGMLPLTIRRRCCLMIKVGYVGDLQATELMAISLHMDSTIEAR
jgi:hypothetical protein